MIRVRLLNEGRPVKQISSRVGEAVILERIQRYEKPYDEVVVMEGELSEGAKEILQRVAKRVIPAAMAAGMALGGASGAQAQQNYFPGTNRSIGQHISDIFSPNYQEIMRQRRAEQETERAAWNARQAEIRRAKIARAREQGRQEGQGIAGTDMPSNTKVYDQARKSQDGKSYVLYDMQHNVIRIPVAGTEFVPDDGHRLAHYLTARGGVYYVRHPAEEHKATEGIVEDPAVGTIPATGGTSSSTIKTTGTTAPGGGSSAPAAKIDDTEDDGKTLALDKDHGLDKETLDAIKKAGVAVDIKENEMSRLEMRIRGIQEGFTDQDMQAILDQYEDSWQRFKSGGDIDENPDFYEALFDYFSNSGEMPYEVARARTGDPIEWITNKMDTLAGNEKVGEGKMSDKDIERQDYEKMNPMEFYAAYKKTKQQWRADNAHLFKEAEEDDLEASPADQAAADKNIIMQLRKAADYDKPTVVSLDDGTRVKTDSVMAGKLLRMFDQLRPDSKELMQRLLNTKKGFDELVAELNKVREQQVQEAAEQYASLNDAYPAGETEIWYWLDDNARDYMMGYDFLKKQGMEITPETIPSTHALIGKIRETNPEKIFAMMQGESWSPNGEARDMIERSGTGHTSMSVGDVIRVGNKWLMVDRYGFKDLASGANESADIPESHVNPHKTAMLIADRIMAEVFDR